MADSKVWNVSEGDELFLAKVKPKDSCQMEEEEDSSEGGKRPKGIESKDSERDVYSFPGDSDPESPPPAPWAHCTFIQRCRKKRVLLRPFSGLGTLKHPVPEPGKRARASPPKSKPAENRGGGVYHFEKDNSGEEAAEEELMKFRESGGKREEEEEDIELMREKEIFTCVECSIYFKKQVHLQEHIVEHCQSSAGDGRQLGKGNRFQCIECGWNLPNRLTLADHHRRHQESRLKILEEIEKLNENGKAKEIQTLDSKVKHMSPDPALMQDTSPASFPAKESDSKIVTSPSLSPVPISTPDVDPAAISSETTLPSSARGSAHVRAVSAYRRRFICTKCNFSTRTPQALANHSKTHNRPQTVMREHQKLPHPGRISKPILVSEHLSGSGSATLPDVTQGATEDGTVTDGTVARPAGQAIFKCVGNRKFHSKRRMWTDPEKFHPRLDDGKQSGNEEQDEGQSKDLDMQYSRREANSPVGVKPHTRAQSNAGKTLSEQTLFFFLITVCHKSLTTCACSTRKSGITDPCPL